VSRDIREAFLRMMSRNSRYGHCHPHQAEFRVAWIEVNGSQFNEKRGNEVPARFLHPLVSVNTQYSYRAAPGSGAAVMSNVRPGRIDLARVVDTLFSWLHTDASRKSDRGWFLLNGESSRARADQFIHAVVRPLHAIVRPTRSPASSMHSAVFPMMLAGFKPSEITSRRGQCV